MRYKMLAVAGLASTLAIGALAHQQGQTSPSQPKPGMMGQGRGMTSGGMMMGMMGQMTNHHQQMTELMNKLMQNMTAIQSEKDPAALKAARRTSGVAPANARADDPAGWHDARHPRWARRACEHALDSQLSVYGFHQVTAVTDGMLLIDKNLAVGDSVRFA
jgi:hypothetical protein